MAQPQAHHSNRFAVLLAAIFLMACAAVIARLFDRGQHGLIRLVMSLGFVGMLISAAFTVEARPGVVRLCRALAGLSVVLLAINTVVGSDDLRATGHVLSLAFFCMVVAVIVRMLLTTWRVTGDTLAASICAYLLLGMIWALVYALVEHFQPGSFRMPEGEEMVLGAEYSSNVFYFSYVTLTTLGYGDVTPAGDAARVLAVLEAMVGQIFLVVLVARLVGISAGQAMDGADSSE